MRARRSPEGDGRGNTCRAVSKLSHADVALTPRVRHMRNPTPDKTRRESGKSGPTIIRSTYINPPFAPTSPYLHRLRTYLHNYERNLKMVKVTLNGKTIAESNATIVVENNHNFPRGSVDESFFTKSSTRCDLPSRPLLCSSHSLTFWVHSTVCPWKGSAKSDPTTVR